MEIFLSYSWDDGKIADSICGAFKPYENENIKIVRDKDILNYMDDIQEFMKTISNKDLVILLISQYYLKSTNCMFEISELVKSSDYKNRILVLVSKETNIFKVEGINQYLLFWQKRCADLELEMDRLDKSNTSICVEELRKAKNIMLKISDFFKDIRCLNLIVYENNITMEDFEKIKEKVFSVMQMKNNLEIKKEIEQKYILDNSKKNDNINLNVFMPTIKNEFTGSCGISIERSNINILITLEHSQIMELFLHMHKNDNYLYQYYENNNYRVKLGNIYADLIFDEVKELEEKLNNICKDYINSLREITACLEVDEFMESEISGGKFKLFRLSRNDWEEIVKIADMLDWGNGKSEWHIFQRTVNGIYVFQPCISTNTKLNPVEHAYFTIEKTDDINDDELWLVMDLKYVIGTSLFGRFDSYKANKRDIWGVRTGYDFLYNEFIPYAKEQSKGRICVDKIRNYSYNNEEGKGKIFKNMQAFYRDNGAYVTIDELNLLKQALKFCLEKKYLPLQEYHYIISKLGLIDINANMYNDIQKLVLDIINKMEMQKEEVIVNKSSRADDYLRCILTFLDVFSKNRLNDYEIDNVLNLTKSLYEKMDMINYIKKYMFFWNR